MQFQIFPLDLWRINTKCDLNLFIILLDTCSPHLNCQVFMTSFHMTSFHILLVIFRELHIRHIDGEIRVTNFNDINSVRNANFLIKKE
jgi:hypothetical protein